MRISSLILILFASFALVGCASSQTDVSKGAATAEGNPASLVQSDQQSGAYQGVGPTQIALSKTASMTTPGGGLAMRLDPATGDLWLWSPKDTRAKLVEVTPKPAEGEPKIRIKGLAANLSNVASVRAEQFADAMTAIQGMTEAEARRRIEQLEEAGDITGDVAEVVTKSVIPMLE